MAFFTANMALFTACMALFTAGMALITAGIALFTAGSACPCSSLGVGPLRVFVQLFPTVKPKDEQQTCSFLSSLWTLIS